MKKLIFVVIFIICVISFCYSQTVNGDTLTVDGKKILKVWGNHYERGYATGYLMGDEIKSISENYYLGYVFYNNPVLYENTRVYFLNNFEVEDKYQSEAQGIIDGMIEAGIDLYSPTPILLPAALKHCIQRLLLFLDVTIHRILSFAG